MSLTAYDKFKAHWRQTYDGMNSHKPNMDKLTIDMLQYMIPILLLVGVIYYLQDSQVCIVFVVGAAFIVVNFVIYLIELACRMYYYFAYWRRHQKCSKIHNRAKREHSTRQETIYRLFMDDVNGHQSFDDMFEDQNQ